MKPLKVSEVNSYIKSIFQGDMLLSNIEVEGEISNIKRHFSGHLYFSLKDEDSMLKCVMFKYSAKSLSMDLADGQKIIAKGYVSIYEQTGAYQLYVKEIYSKGLGDLYLAYEKLKQELEKEGLFKKEFKKDLPTMPRKVGIVTSSTGAAIRDIVSVIKRRFPPCEILIYPSLVQGPNAPKEIIQGLVYLDKREDVDLIITGRGGGSIEDLWAFNDEELARTIFSLDTPVISAVGHETDFTIADFVADLRAATPSAAAELAVPNIDSLNQELDNYFSELLSSYRQKVDRESNRLEIFKKGLKYNNPVYRLNNNKLVLDGLYQKLVNVTRDRLNDYRRKRVDLENRLNLLNPTLSIEKGNGILIDADGKLIKSVEDISIGDRIDIVMRDGNIKALIEDFSKGEDYHGCK